MGMDACRGARDVLKLATGRSGVAWRRQHISRPFIKAVLATLLFALPAGAAGREPRAVIEQLHGALLEVMQDAERLGYAGRYERLKPVLEGSYDFPLMARIATGRAWSDLSEEQRARLVELFAKMSVATYAARFDGYGGEHFEIAGQTPAPREGVVVESRIVPPDDDPVGLHYVLRHSEDGWRIVDVLLDGRFSELARQRAEFSAVLGDGGFPTLVASLERKIAELEGSG
jgi:phospholipid transport system substrate-binding protein